MQAGVVEMSVRNSGTSTTSYFVSSDYSVSSRYTSLYLAPTGFPIAHCFGITRTYLFHRNIRTKSLSLSPLSMSIRPLVALQFFSAFQFFFLLIFRNETMGLPTNIKSLLLASLVTHFYHATSDISTSSRQRCA